MKNLKTLFLFVIFINLFSCSDTNVSYGTVDQTVDAVAVSGQFVKRVLIEDYTGTWCGNCTRVSYGIDQVFAQPNNRAVAVAIHNGNDPFNFVGIAPLKNLISPNNDLELPQSRLNRTITWTFPEPNNLQQVKNLTSNNCGLGLAMNSTVTGGNINLEVKIKFAENYSNLRLVAYVLESNLIYFQRNYTPYYSGQNPIQNYEHNHVLRAGLTDLMGNVISESTNLGQTVTKSFVVPVPVNVSNQSNVDFVAFIVDENNNVINVRAADANENQSLEQNP